jgi:hypothetical protein
LEKGQNKKVRPGSCETIGFEGAPLLKCVEEEYASVHGGATSLWRTYARLKVDADGARNVVVVIGLVEKHVFSVGAVRRKVFKDAVCAVGTRTALGGMRMPVREGRQSNHMGCVERSDTVRGLKTEKTRADARFGASVSTGETQRQREFKDEL